MVEVCIHFAPTMLVERNHHYATLPSSRRHACPTHVCFDKVGQIHRTAGRTTLISCRIRKQQRWETSGALRCPEMQLRVAHPSHHSSDVEEEWKGVGTDVITHTLDEET
jgi:hypothetical protein